MRCAVEALLTHASVSLRLQHGSEKNAEWNLITIIFAAVQRADHQSERFTRQQQRRGAIIIEFVEQQSCFGSEKPTKRAMMGRTKPGEKKKSENEKKISL